MRLPGGDHRQARPCLHPQVHTRKAFKKACRSWMRATAASIAAGSWPSASAPHSSAGVMPACSGLAPQSLRGLERGLTGGARRCQEDTPGSKQVPCATHGL